jgi:hypothetical protein
MTIGKPCHLMLEKNLQCIRFFERHPVQFLDAEPADDLLSGAQYELAALFAVAPHDSPTSLQGRLAGFSLLPKLL